jgi:hypothetical protein
MQKAKFVKEITVTDPDSKEEVKLEVYKADNGSMFAIDSSFLEQNTEDENYPVIPDPFIILDDSEETEQLQTLQKLILV